VTNPSPNRKALGAALRRFRDDCGLTQEALAAKAGIHRTYLSDVERGLRNPTFDVLEKLLAASGATWTAFGSEIDEAANRHR
jgi:transcriptional regulator with XRE-family HTH domain